MTTTTRIVDLVQTKLAGRKIDLTGFVDALLGLASEVGEIHCCLADEGRLRFKLGTGETCEIEVDACRGKLRMLCARLAVLCNETPGAAVSPYGGEGRMLARSSGEAMDKASVVRFKNTPGEQEFSIADPVVKKPS